MSGCPRLFSISFAAKQPQSARLKSSLFVFALGAALVLFGSAKHAEAQCSGAGTTTYTSTGGVSVVGGTVSTSTNTITVPSLPAGSTITCVSVLLNGVTTNGATYVSMDYASFMLTAPSGQKLQFLGSTGDGTDGDNLNDAGSGLAGVNITVADNASQNAPAYPNIWPHTGSATVKPSSYYLLPANNSQTQPPLPVGGNSTQWAQSDGTGTFANLFETGATPSGGWTLTLTDNDTIGILNGDPVSVTSWSLVMTVAETSNANTTTSLSSSSPNNTSFTSGANSSVTFTANVSSGGGTPTGTVNFTDAGTTIAGCGAVALSGGVATCNTSFSTEGIHTLEALYSGGAGFNASDSEGLNQFVKHHSTLTSGEYCNTAAIVENTSTVSPYPSVINVGTDTTPLSGSVAGVRVNLNGLSDSQGLGISDAFLLVAPDHSKAYNLDFMSDVGTSSNQPSVNIFFADLNPSAPLDGPLVSGTYAATDNRSQADTFPASQSPAPSVPATINYAQPDSFGPNPFTFSQAFNGANGNGDWSLFAINNTGTVINVTGGWCLAFTVNNGAGTVTELSSTANPASTGSQVTFTATVSTGGSPVTSGYVTFTENGVAPAGSSSNVVPLNDSGVASISTSSLAEGDHNILATYSGVSNTYDPSSGSVWQRVNTATTASGAGTSANPAVYCNPGGFTLPNPNQPVTVIGAAAPNPSNIVVSNLPGTINTVSLELENFQTNPIADTVLWTSSLLVGPGATSTNALDFFTGPGTTDNDTFLSLGNYIFADSAATLVPQTNFGPATYKPTSYENSSIKGTYTASPSGFYTLPNSWDYAAPRGSSTFSSLFDNTNGNGLWSLYLYQNTAVDNPQASAAGWCLSFIQNLPVLTITKSHSGDFTQGQQGAQFAVDINNEGPGSTGDPDGSHPLTVTDVLAGYFTPGTLPTGTPWNCSATGQVVTCTSHLAIGQGDSYPTLAIPVNVSSSESASTTNHVSVSGGGVTSANSNVDTVTILPAPLLSISKVPIGSFTQGQTAEWDLTVFNQEPSSTTNGTVSVTDTLPANYTIANFGSTLFWNCTGVGTGSASCSTTQVVAGGSSFSLIHIIVNVPANSQTSVTNNAWAWGGGDLDHTNLSNAASTFSTVNVAQVPATIAINGSSTQSAYVTTAFGSLAVTIKDAGGAVIKNYTPVVFTATTGGSGQSGTFSNNTGTTTVSANPSGVTDPGTFTANGIVGSYSVGVTAGSATATFNLTNNPPPTQAPAITSAASANFVLGQPGTFTVTTTGIPAATVSDGGATLPSGVTFTPNADGTGTLAGTPTQSGIFPITFAATNGTPPDAAQTFTLTVTIPTPFIDIVSPTTVTPGSTPSSLTITGANFVSGSTVSFNGTSLTPFSVTSNQIVVNSGFSALSASGVTLPVTVVNPTTSPLVGTSNVAFFPVTTATTSVTTSGTNYATGNSAYSVAVGDFTGKGKLDLAVANEGSNTVSILLGNGDGTFQSQTTYPTGNFSKSVAVGDFNGDGYPDLAVANGSDATVSILLNKGDGSGTFQSQTTYSTGSSPYAVAVGDFNGDGKLDLVVANAGGGSVSILLGNGNGTFKGQTTYSTGAYPQSVAVGDFNGDGKLDLAVGNAASNTVSILLGNGDGTFQSQTTFSTGIGPYSVAVGDFSGDGKLDLAVVNNCGNDPACESEAGTMSILLGDGNGNFTLKSSPGTGGFPQSVAVGDFNGDGKLDLAVANSISGTLTILLGNGDGTFPNANSPSTDIGPNAVAVGDFNNDGRLDFVTANGGSSATVLLQSPLDQFTIQTSPTGLQVSVDNGSSQTAPVTVTWQIGSSHTISTTSPQTANGGQYAFASWSDSGPISHSVTASASTLTYTATFNATEYQLTISANPSNGGTVTPSSGYYSASSSQPITATPAANYAFTGWSANPDIATTSSPSTTVTMNAPETVTANFAPFATAVSTTTALVSAENPSFTSDPVKFTASVTYGSNTPVGASGTVTFTENSNPVAGGPTGPVALDANGTASFTTSALTEGTHNILATYSGYNSVAASYLSGSGTLTQEVDNHTTVNGNQFCNTGAISVPDAGGAGTPYPSRIFVTGYTANVGHLTLALNNINSGNIPLTDLLLVGPTGAKIIPFARVGDASTISGVNITLDDAATSPLPGGSPLSTGTFNPTSLTGDTSLFFPAPAPPVNAANYAANDGSATLGSVFNYTAPNGTWALFAMTSAADDGTVITGGWCLNITPAAAPAITSATSTNFNLNQFGTFTVTTTGAPTPSLSDNSASLPNGVSFVDNGDGTGTLSGTPTVGGTFPITFTATNGVSQSSSSKSANASTKKTTEITKNSPVTGVNQSFTLYVGQPPTIQSGNSATFTVGASGSFGVTTTGSPMPSISDGGATLPGNVTFTDNGNGTGTLAGTPAAGTGGVYHFTFTAQNGVAPNATQPFTLTVNQAPAIKSGSSVTFVVGTNGSFPITTSGYPTVTSIGDNSASLPTGVHFVDNGNGTASLSGTPAAGTGGVYHFNLTAQNGVTPNATQSFTLTVNQAPAITSGNGTTFIVGTNGSFPITSSGYPTVTSISDNSASLPTGVHFVDNGNGTASLSGTPAAGTGGVYHFTLTASNGVSPNANQSFTLTVDQPAAITSANHATFTLGKPNTFPVTTTGYPIPSIGETGPLPSGVTLTDNHNGTATLGGTPTQGGVFPITITATNGVNPPTGSPTVGQSFTLTTSGPLLQVTPPSINFGTVYLHNTQSANVTLKNIGTSTVNISNVALTLGAGTSSTIFKFVNGCSSTLEAGHSCNITINFNGSPAGSPSATLKITDNSPGSPQTVPMSATIINPKGQFDTASLGFATVKVGSSHTKTITFTNVGTTTLDITSFSVTGPNHNDFNETNNCPSTLAPSKNCVITLTFKPAGTGQRSATLTALDNTQVPDQTVSLSGKGD